MNKFQIVKKYRYECGYCGQSYDYANSFGITENEIPICKRCSSYKKDKTDAEFKKFIIEWIEKFKKTKAFLFYDSFKEDYYDGVEFWHETHHIREEYRRKKEENEKLIQEDIENFLDMNKGDTESTHFHIVSRAGYAITFKNPNHPGNQNLFFRIPLPKIYFDEK